MTILSQHFVRTTHLLLMAGMMFPAVTYGEDAIQLISRDGTVRYPEIQNYGAKKTNGVFQFDGKTSRISFPYQDNRGDKTFWVRFKNTESNGGDKFRILLSNTNTGDPSWGFTLHTGWGTIFARVCDAQKEDPGVSYRPRDINAWHEVCLTYQPSIHIMRFYVDGQFQDISELNGYTPAPKDQKVWLGWDMSDHTSYFTGEISKVCIFNRCLSEKEIAQMSGTSLAEEKYSPIDPKTLPNELDFQLKSFKPGKNIDWLRKNKGKFVYGVDTAAAADQFSQAGFNVMAPCGFNAAPDSLFNSTNSSVLQVAKHCKAIGKKTMPYYWFTPGFFTQQNYKKEAPSLQYKYVNRSGVERYAPCPINRQYWDYYLRQGLIKTAQLSKEYPIVAIAVDFELYSTEDGFGTCYCDGCWGRFCRKMKIDGCAIPPAKRYLYLAEHKLLERYNDWQSKEVWELGAWVAQAVHEVNPDVALAYINYDRGWFAKNVVQGFAADGVPAMAFTEGLSYACGYTPRVDEMAKVLRQENTLFYPGLWISFWEPVPNLAEQAYKLGMHADGWWAAPGFFLTEPQYKDFHQWDGQREGGPHGPSEAYFKLFKEANEKLIQSESRAGRFQMTTDENGDVTMVSKQRVVASK
jgi:hypothetical protein